MSAPNPLDIAAILTTLRAAAAGGFDPCLTPADVLKLKRMVDVQQKLLEALEEAVRHVEAAAFRENVPWLSSARAAIAKARGES